MFSRPAHQKRKQLYATKLRLPAFPPVVWLVLAGTLLIRTAFFLIWPFLSVILLRRFHIAPSQIGLILGTGALVSSTTGFYLGNLSDRFGRRDVMVAGCAGNVVAFVILATANSVLLYITGAVLVGLSRSAIETPASGLISEAIPEARLRELAFHWRYFLSNVGAAIGPLFGFVFGLATQQATFLITALAYLIFSAVILRAFRERVHRPLLAAREAARFRAALEVVRLDHPFLLVIISSFLTYAAYAQVESTLVQYLNLDGHVTGIAVTTAIIATNAVTIILFQFPLLRLLRDYDLHIRIQIGLVLFVAGFLAYSILSTGEIGAWIGATWVLSLGEAILFPTLSLQAERMAPRHLRGSYFGALSLSGLGFAAGPSAGGAMLQYLGGPSTFVITAAVTAIGGITYWQSHRLKISRMESQVQE